MADELSPGSGRTGDVEEPPRLPRPRGMNLNTRLFLYFVLLASVPLAAVCGLTHRLYSTYIEKLIVQQKKDLILSSLEELALLRQQEEKVSDQILCNAVLQETLLLPPAATAEERVLRVLAVEPLLSALEVSSRSVGALAIGRNGDTYRSLTTLGLADQLPLLGELLGNDRLESSRGGNVWIPLTRDVVLVVLEPQRERDRSFLYLVRKINNLAAPHQQIGVLILQVPYEPVAAVLARSSRGAGEHSILVDADGTVLARSQGKAEIGKPLEAPFDQGFVRLGHAADAYVTVEERSGIVQYVRARDSDWAILQFTPRANLLERTRQVRRLTLAVVAACVVMAFAAAYLLSRSITRPIVRLSGAMLAFGSGRLDLRAPGDRSDEIGQLEASFNKMAGDTKALMARIEEEHKLRRKLELNMLEYQINPHFLYNILDSINWMAQKEGHREIGAMVTALARFFRIGLSSGRDEVTVAEELEHARYFLIISQMRYRDCFRFEIEAEESVKRSRTLKILLQPILENTMKHGFEKSRTDGFVLVSCRSDGGDIVFDVKDNGRGMDAPTLEALQDRLERGEGTEMYTGGIGLINIQQRLRLHYGEAYGVEVRSSAGQGTTVRFRIPRQE